MFSGPQGNYNNGYVNESGQSNENGYPNHNANSHSIETGGYQVIGNNTNVTGPTKAEVKRAKAAAQDEKKGRKKKDRLTGKAGKVITVGKKAVNAAGRDPISAPSAQSGGIPNPTEEYLSRASGLPATTPMPQPMLVVIDLNGTLLYRPSKKQPTDFVERPHARKFMAYCINTFHVVVWSSARPDNVRNMCARLLTADQLGRVVTVWGRDKFGLSAKDYDKRTQCYKRLTKLWEDPVVKAAHPDGESWHQGNTVLIDDSEEKARSEPYNAITLPEFAGNVNEEPRVLPLVHDYLNTLAYQADISTYIRTTPFKANEAKLAGTDDEDLTPSSVDEMAREV
ncbi:phosphoprotein phosphatase [Lasiosphaeria ovina]|uniref:Mitochondrial import inner membrane translocase subunit TIM50 n=1 Tax=Lasiosphaeria ovina TaxID=92902 RepID=A0AAE0JYI5_9PEZI|nr:phosphoprotein phosphatase [Lasiosphaeria ovina]